MKTKLKTRNAASKRFKVTGTGKVLHRGHGVRHLKSNKSNRRLRAQKLMKEVNGVFKVKIKKMLGV